MARATGMTPHLHIDMGTAVLCYQLCAEVFPNEYDDASERFAGQVS